MLKAVSKHMMTGSMQACSTMSCLRTPKWQTLLQEIVDKGNRHVQVATVNVDGLPACRTMGFGKFWRDTQCLLLGTHAKSLKAGELARHPYMEVCCWDEPSQQQFRLRGSVHIVDASCTDADLQAERQELWDKLETPSVRQWFLDPKRAPGQPFQEPAENKDHDPALVPPNQLLLKIDVTEVDYVHLGDDVRSVWSNERASTAESCWHETKVNP